MRIYLVCEIVDLGYRVISAYKDKSAAETEIDRLNKAYQERNSDILKWIPKTQYEIDEVDLI